MKEKLKQNVIKSGFQRPTGSFLKQLLQVTAESVHKSVSVSIVAADSPEEAAELVKEIQENGKIVSDVRELKNSEALVDSVGSTQLKESKVLSVRPALQGGQFDLTDFAAVTADSQNE